MRRLRSTLRRTRRCDLYHAALIATVGGVGTIVEVAPIPDGAGRQSRGVVAEGPVGSRRLGHVRLFRYEVRRWTGGVIPDLTYAVASPVQITGETGEIRHALDLLGFVPTPVWGRDELRTGDMWNSNSVVSWTLCRAGLLDAAGEPPPGGRAPGWDAGIKVARSGRTSSLS
jgi:hypothetical protein